MAIRGPISKFALAAGFNENVFPPITASVSMAAAGAIAVKNELCTIFDDFLRAKDETFRTIEKND